jgi:hypothetical protein
MMITPKLEGGEIPQHQPDQMQQMMMMMQASSKQQRHLSHTIDSILADVKRSPETGDYNEDEKQCPSWTVPR